MKEASGPGVGDISLTSLLGDQNVLLIRCDSAGSAMLSSALGVTRANQRTSAFVANKLSWAGKLEVRERHTTSLSGIGPSCPPFIGPAGVGRRPTGSFGDARLSGRDRMDQGTPGLRS